MWHLNFVFYSPFPSYSVSLQNQQLTIIMEGKKKSSHLKVDRGQNGLKILLYKSPFFQRTALSDLFSGSLTQSLPCTVFSLGALVKNNQRKLFNTTVAWGGELELGQAEKPKSWKGKAGGDIHRALKTLMYSWESESMCMCGVLSMLWTSAVIISKPHL